MVQYSNLGLDEGHSMGGIYGQRSHSSASSSSPPSLGNNLSASMLVVPQPIKSNGQSLPSNGRKYHCKMCPQQVFGSKADLQLHTQVHMREAKPYKCSQCNKSFANSSYLSQHTRIHLGIKPYRCEICQRKFTQLSHLQQHIRTHTGDKPYKCRHHGCVKAFSQLSNLQSHSRCHQTDKPYKCNSCYKCFIDEATLLDHIPKHKESKHLKTHICQFCGKSYTQETYLAKHMQKHSERCEKRNSSNSSNLSSSSLAPSPPLPTNTSSTTSTTSTSNTSGDPYWPHKVDPSIYSSCLERNSDYSSAIQSHHREMMMDRNHSLEDLRAQSNLNYSDQIVKSSSAFSPLQNHHTPGGGGGASMLNSPASSFSMTHPSRGYSFYDPLTFPKHHSQVGFDTKPVGTNCFPNQLISLSQIRNYAHQPSSDHLLQSLKEKAGQVTQ